MPNRFQSLTERFAEQVFPCPATGCWLWTGAPHGRNGYGQIFKKGRGNIMAHRLSWEIHNGAIPHGMQVLHRCDVPLCVNPHHLFIGTQKENMADASSKKRFNPAFGEKSNLSKITSAIALAILTDKCSGKDAAEKYCVSKYSVSKIRSGKTWRSIGAFQTPISKNA